MTSSDALVVGLFPLGLVLLPGEVIPLHIFEPRYRRLVADLREQGGEFGIVLQREAALADAGCTAMLVEVVEELEDGRLNILVEGKRRFHILELQTPEDAENEYLRGVVELFDDDPVGEPPPQLNERATALFLRLLALMAVEKPRTPLGREPLSFRFASAVEFGTALKQQLLESVSETDRLETLIAVMGALIPRLETRLEREDAIRGNGKGY